LFYSEGIASSPLSLLL